MTDLSNQQRFAANINLIKRIENYWSTRADAFGMLRREELAGHRARLWKEEIIGHFPDINTPLNILDVGTGTGFFAILLAKAGHIATGIDISPKMLAGARKLAKQENCRVDFLQMDVSAPLFADNSFDCIVGRNITWTLPDAEKAYREWHRILKPGGLLINFDADYGRVNFTDLRTYNGRHAHSDLSEALVLEGEKIRKELPISSRLRPEWDLDVLDKSGFTNLFCDREISNRIYAIKDSTYNPVPMFSIGGRKAIDSLCEQDSTCADNSPLKGEGTSY
ncbi:MAG: class I SAM-dependent methyltransferase [Desulfovibrio sp.]|nr:class I SAM-dependent methyltransferase [Desulfovibrio sp.]